MSWSFEDIVGTSAALRRVLHQVEIVAPTEATVLITGETGTGKELMARAIHHLSQRRGRAFVKLNCAAIPTGLLESELFGHEKGAFTGAVTQRIGRFELANQGTIFLDEIGELPLEVQPKLLRVLQDQEFERLGSSRTLRTDARLIAATNRDLSAMVEAQTFRADLFYRVNVFPVQVPPLRERPDDIPLLVRHFVQQFARRMHKPIETIPTDTMQAFLQYPWPGNIRELQNILERAVILSPGPVLQVPRTDLTPRAPATRADDARDARSGQAHAPPERAGGDRAAAHPPRAGGDQVGGGRAPRRGRASGNEALHAAVPHAEARDLPPRDVIDRVFSPLSSRDLRPPASPGWRPPQPPQSPGAVPRNGQSTRLLVWARWHVCPAVSPRHASGLPPPRVARHERPSSQAGTGRALPGGGPGARARRTSTSPEPPTAHRWRREGRLPHPWAADRGSRLRETAASVLKRRGGDHWSW